MTSPIVDRRTLDQLEEWLPAADITLTGRECAACDRISALGGAVAVFRNTAPWMKTALA